MKERGICVLLRGNKKPTVSCTVSAIQGRTKSNAENRENVEEEKREPLKGYWQHTCTMLRASIQARHITYWNFFTLSRCRTFIELFPNVIIETHQQF